MSRDMSCIRTLYYTALAVSVWLYRIYTYRRGVCVARFDQSGNAKTSNVRRVTGTGSHAFFV